MVDCVFCQMLSGEKPGDFVYKDETVAAFWDANPQAPVHILLIPVKHVRSVNDLKEEDRQLMAELVFRAREIARHMKITESGYRLRFNVERGGGQLIFHLHLHLVGGWERM